mmetsp:Transcript_11799/g.28643  ORF Transcript_11799/g.28643 Transcript_11799/m.28643 type:complete len:204 (-) Transcript_11799:3068-3679(-)
MGTNAAFTTHDASISPATSSSASPLFALRLPPPPPPPPLPGLRFLEALLLPPTLAPPPVLGPTVLPIPPPVPSMLSPPSPYMAQLVPSSPAPTPPPSLSATLRLAPPPPEASGSVLTAMYSNPGMSMRPPPSPRPWLSIEVGSSPSMGAPWFAGGSCSHRRVSALRRAWRVRPGTSGRFHCSTSRKSKRRHAAAASTVSAVTV